MKRIRRRFSRPRRKKKRWKGRAPRLCVICARQPKTCSRLPRRNPTRLGRMAGLRKGRPENTKADYCGFPPRIAVDVEITPRRDGDRPASIIEPPLRAGISNSPASKSWQSIGAIVRCRTESRFIFTVTRHVIRYSIPSSRNWYLRRERRLWLKLNRPPNNYWFSR